MFQMNPEFRSMTAVCVIEDLSKCPLGYTPINRTHDTDSESDLWRDGFFSKKVTRYVCTSKSQGRPEHVIAAINITNDREVPPEGFSIIQSTVDTNQKSFQKKQLCYKLAHFRTNVESIIDLIILGKYKPPLGYDYIGEINGMHFCVRKVSAITRLSSPSLSYGILPNSGMAHNALYPQIQQSLNDMTMNGNSNGYSPASNLGQNPDRFTTSVPTSPAFYPGQFSNKNPAPYNSSTLNSITGLEGVPLHLREDLLPANGDASFARSSVKPMFPIKSEAELEQEYSYDFRTEREVLINGSL